MKLFETTTKGLVKINDLRKVSAGSEYAVTDIVKQSLYLGKLTTYIYETNHPGATIVITDERGRKPYAVATNDSSRDGFEEYEVSKVLSRVGYYIVISAKELGSEDDRVVIMRVNENVDATTIFPCHVKATCITNDLFSEVYDELPMFQPVLDHVSRINFMQDTPIQIRDKYCFNKSRIFVYAIMKRNNKGEMISEKHEQQVLLNNNSLAQLENGLPVDVGVYRLFYSKRFSQGRTLIAEGVKLNKDSLTFDVNELIYSGELDPYEIQNLGTGYLSDDLKVVVIMKSVVPRLLIKVGQQILRIPLSETEVSFIKDLRSIYKTA